MKINNCIYYYKIALKSNKKKKKNKYKVKKYIYIKGII